MDWVKIITPPDEVKEAGIVVVPLSATHSFVPKKDIKRIADITGRIPREGAFHYGKFEGVKVGSGLPVMVFVHLGKEIVELFGLEKIFFYKKEQIKTDQGDAIDMSDARNLFIFIDCVPGGSKNVYGDVPDVLQFGDIGIQVPDAVKKTFKRASAHAKVHEIRDDHGYTVAYARDNKIWIPFDIAALDHSGRELNWMPTSVTRLILSRAVQPALTQDPPTMSEEERVAILKQSEQRWTEVWKADSVQRMENISAELDRNERNYKSLCEQMADCVLRREEFSRQLAFERSSGDRDEAALQEFERILENIPELVSVEFDGNSIVFHTSMIFIEEDMAEPPKEFEPFPLGEFKITCQAGLVPTIENMTRKLEYSGTHWYHPHAKTGHICWGNISGKIAEYSGMRRWHDVVSLVVQFLKNVLTTDEWGRKGFERWQEAGKIEQEVVTNKERIAPRAIEWAKVTPTVRVYNLKPGDAVMAKCPRGCPLLNKYDDAGKPRCSIQGDGRREGEVKEMLDEFLNVTWKHVMNEGQEPEEVECIGFTYDDVLRLDGEPMYEGHNPPALYPDQEIEREIADGIQGVVDTTSASVAKRQAKLVHDDSEDKLIEIDQDDEEMTLDEIERMTDEIEM